MPDLADRPRIVVAMSGGVDSSAVAALLTANGYDVIGMMLRLWSEDGREANNRCCTPEAMALARRVSAHLSIPFYVVDAKAPFRNTVVEAFLRGYAQGETPNPCLVCNQYIRWEFLLERALALGATYMATGHYARLEQQPGSAIQLLRAVDRQKDQSYVLHVLDQTRLRHALFPLGIYTKTQVRQLARDYNLPVAERPESQDLCFLGGDDYRDFLVRNAPDILEPGSIIDSQGNLLGQHQGLALFTIGQRKGLGISSSDPMYVVNKDPVNNTLIVGRVSDLGQDHLIAADAHWVEGINPEHPFKAKIQIRYRANEVSGLVTPLETNRFHVQFDHPLRDITPGQAAVIYQEDVCLGGGIIHSH